MAEKENEKENENDDISEEEASGGKSKMMIIIAVVVLALIGGGAALFLGGDEKAADSNDTAEKEGTPPAKQAPIYLTVKDPFVVNFSAQSKGAARYLQIKLKVMARSQDTIDAFTLNTPAIQHELLLLFFAQKYDALNTTKGTKLLQKQTMATINKVLKAENNSGELEAVYFTSLIMQ